MDSRLLACFSQRIRHAVVCLSSDVQAKIEEIRIRINQPIEIRVQNQSYFLTESGQLCRSADQGLVATPEDGQKILNLISRHSVYALEEELRRGFITIFGGHRVGIAGRAVVDNGRVQHVKHIRFFNFRVAREMKGIAEGVVPYLLDNGSPLNTLIISPPQCGKTTLLRDIIRVLSSGKAELGLRGVKVGVVDERSEIASCLDGLPQHDLGPRADVLDACPKAEGMMMLIRSMSPQVVACDEIGSEQDTLAILEALHAGVTVVVTAHGSTLADIKRRPGLKPLFQTSVFERFVVLSHRKGAGTIELITDAQERLLYPSSLRGMNYA
ncbi:stage III sporulation protein AA [Caldalkalibacillus thermarum]|uniref:stage III sporulation protein AA n=1 Tax=Caldalkalibacillus thermarum TaxID=296745 RepID=UPI0016650F1D|nr:stage III sporulation protein AA [Caldalkalibacillus thermarum]GGK19003.1 stage III sporulation protein AA [Caldalkalibacillus thermarum]